MRLLYTCLVIASFSLAATVYAGCYSTTRTHTRDSSECVGGGGGRLYIMYTPSSWLQCGFSANGFAGCGSRTQAAEKRELQMTYAGCNPPIVGDTGWMPDGTKPNDYDYRCCIRWP
jgi:hypothetical protein